MPPIPREPLNLVAVSILFVSSQQAFTAANLMAPEIEGLVTSHPDAVGSLNFSAVPLRIFASSVKSHSWSVAPTMSCSTTSFACPLPSLQQSGPVVTPEQDVQNFPSSKGWLWSLTQLVPWHV